MSTRQIMRTLGAGALALLIASSASAQIRVSRVQAAPIRSQMATKSLIVKPSVLMKAMPPVDNQPAKVSLASDRAEAQRDMQTLQRQPLGSLAHPTHPHMSAQRPQTSRVGVIGGRR
jgi:hypothetical protein